LIEKQDQKKNLKEQLREQLKEEKKIVKPTKKHQQQQQSEDNGIKEIEELTRVKKLMLENGMNKEAEELDAEIKEKIKNHLAKIKTSYAPVSN